jgi:hypothetical protein
MPLTRKCPFCAEEIMVGATKCRHCGEFLDGAPPELRRPAPGVAPPCGPGDKTLTVVVLTLLGIALLMGGILWAVVQGLRQGQPIIPSETSSPSSVPSQPAMSIPFARGYEEGKWSGNLDRRYDTYSHFTRGEADKRQKADTWGYRHGTDEYGDFWAGYQAGYLEAR